MLHLVIHILVASYVHVGTNLLVQVPGCKNGVIVDSYISVQVYCTCKICCGVEGNGAIPIMVPLAPHELLLLCYNILYNW